MTMVAAQDESADRGRALHGVGQPDMARGIWADFPTAPIEEQEGRSDGRCGRGDGRPAVTADRRSRRTRSSRSKAKRATDPQEEAGVPDPVDEKGLFPAGRAARGFSNQKPIRRPEQSPARPPSRRT
ncbi:MAG: hypothetical protein MZV70_69195 [Desulfobacterales bacterium]|nr:hypothetical protein [Desulfobacterales bacterium]